MLHLEKLQQCNYDLNITAIGFLHDFFFTAHLPAENNETVIPNLNIEVSRFSKGMVAAFKKGFNGFMSELQ